jgi:N-acetylmuramoyl-L-alanine amidase
VQRFVGAVVFVGGVLAGHGSARAQAGGGGPIIERPLPFGAERAQLTLDYIHQHYDPARSSVRITPRMIVVHWTDTPSVDSTLRLFDPAELPASRPDIARGGRVNVSAHYLVGRDGTILRLMSDTVMARHTIGLNLIAIGIENVGGDASGPLTDRQLAADRWLVLDLLARYPTITYLIGHCEYGRFRHSPLWEERDSTYITPKTDPGAEFMARLRQSLGRPDLADHYVGGG